VTSTAFRPALKGYLRCWPAVFFFLAFAKVTFGRSWLLFGASVGLAAASAGFWAWMVSGTSYEVREGKLVIKRRIRTIELQPSEVRILARDIHRDRPVRFIIHTEGRRIPVIVRLWWLSRADAQALARQIRAMWDFQPLEEADPGVSPGTRQGGGPRNA